MNGSTEPQSKQNKAEVNYFLISEFFALRLNVTFPVSGRTLINIKELMDWQAMQWRPKNGDQWRKKKKISF